jgi:CheY-like chemotaxis protein
LSSDARWPNDSLRSGALLVGDARPPEFAAARKDLARLGPCVAVANAAEACAALASGERPEIVVLVQLRPGEFREDEIDQLRRAAPIARLIVLAGSWCEGETRTGRPPPGTQRIYWHQWPARIDAELARLAAGECPGWGLPLTATEDERLLHASAESPSPRHGLVAVAAASAGTYDALADACRAAGYSTAWLRAPGPAALEGVAAVLCDLDGTERDAAESARHWAGQFSPVPVVVIASFPRADDIARLSDAGAANVLAKPFLVGDLLRHLDWATGRDRVLAGSYSLLRSQ